MPVGRWVCFRLLAFSWTGKRVRWSEAEQPALQEPDGYRQTVQIIGVRTGHPEVTFRRSQSPAWSTKLQISRRGGPPSQPSWSGSALCLLSSHTPTKEKPQGRNRSAPARAAGPDAASCCWLCVGKMADSVEERRPTLHSPISDNICQRGRVNDGRSHTLSHLLLPSNRPTPLHRPGTSLAN